MAICCPLQQMRLERFEVFFCLTFSISQGSKNTSKYLRDSRMECCQEGQPRPQGLLAFQNGGGSGEDPGTQQITCLQRGWRCIQNGGYGKKGKKNWVRDAEVKINKMSEKAEVQFKKK